MAQDLMDLNFWKKKVDIRKTFSNTKIQWIRLSGQNLSLCGWSLIAGQANIDQL